MNKLEFFQIEKLYNYLDNLHYNRFSLGPQFVDGSPNDLGQRKIFGISRGGPEAYLTVIFPITWHFIEDDIPLLQENSSSDVFVDFASFFGLDVNEAHQICIKKNYMRPNLNNCLRRIYSITKGYGFKIIEK